MSNIGLQDASLSLKAKGLLAYMLTMPDDWDFYETELINHFPDGLSALREAVKELIERGYIDRKRIRNTNGTLGKSIWTLYDLPKKPRITSLNDLEAEDSVNPFEKDDVEPKASPTPQPETYSLEKITNFMLANGFGSLNPMQSSIIDDFISDRLNKENAPKADEIISMILKAFELAKKNGSNNFNYVKAILNGWDSKGYMTLSDVPTASYLKNDDQQPQQETKAMPSGVSELFNQFWSNYPKQQGKGQAVVEFANALNHGANAQEIITKAKEYADYVTAENTEMQFIKYPANWLKRQGWLDNYKTSINEQEDKLGW